jgi:hypothetical protein
MHKEMCAPDNHHYGIDGYCNVCEHLVFEFKGVPWVDCPVDCIGKYVKDNLLSGDLRFADQDGSFITFS